MNDRFRFRVWDQHDKCWQTSVVLLEDGRPEYWREGYKLSRNGIVQFCTGLKDKNGKLIYEGDIIQYYSKSGLQIKPQLVEWYKNGWAPWIISEQLEWAENLEIIGNIYENPELLNNF